MCRAPETSDAFQRLEQVLKLPCISGTIAKERFQSGRSRFLNVRCEFDPLEVFVDFQETLLAIDFFLYVVEKDRLERPLFWASSAGLPGDRDRLDISITAISVGSPA